MGYVGTAFNGFQDQKGSDVRTVEGELKEALGYNFPCAGRTDKVLLHHLLENVSIYQ